MKALMIRDMEPTRQVLAVDLRHVLTALGSRALSSDWRVRNVWATGNATSALESLDDQQTVTGATLKSLAENVIQIIDGEFAAFDPGSVTAWVIVEAVDSSYYTVRAEDDAVLETIRRSFQEVSAYEHPDA